MKKLLSITFLMSTLFTAINASATGVPTPEDCFEFNYASQEITDYLCEGKKVTIPDTIDGVPVSIIGNVAFFENELTSVVIPDGVRSIGEAAFYENELTSVVIPHGVTNIKDAAFMLNKLTSVTIPDSVTRIGNYAFSWNRLTSVVIPDSVTSIGDHAFDPGVTGPADRWHR